MKALIIGGAGFVGGYLTDHLQKDCQWSVGVTKLSHESLSANADRVYDLDILDSSSVLAVLQEEHPDYIFHLAAQSSVALSWKNPTLTIDVNIKGTVNVLDGVRQLDYKPRVLLIGSGEEYGHVQQGECPIKENNHLRPGNIYAATKVCQNMIGKIYADAHDMDVIMVRAFNHIGPGQGPCFVISDFCKQVAEIEAGLREPIIYVGNLEAKRDFTDVRDVVRAYALLVKDGRSGEVYNVGSGTAIAISTILHEILALSSTKIEVRIDTSRLRPIDIPMIEADVGKLSADIAWAAQIQLQDTLQDTLKFWRKTTKLGE